MSRRRCFVQDAHELLLDLLNDISELLEAEEKARSGAGGAATTSADAAEGGSAVPAKVESGQQAATPPSTSAKSPAIRTWVHDLFQVGV